MKLFDSYKRYRWQIVSLILISGVTGLLWAGERFGMPVLVPQIGHTGAIWSIDGTEDRSSIVTAGVDGTVKFWTSDGRLIRSFDVNRVSFHFATFAENDKEIVAFSSSGELFRWKTDGTFLERKKSEIPTGLIRHHTDGKNLCVLESEGRVSLRTLEGKLLLTHRFEDIDLTSGAVSPDRKMIFAGGQKGRIRLYGPRPPEEEKKEPEDRLPPFVEYELDEGGEEITSAAFSPSGSLIAATNRSGSLFLWNTARKLLASRSAHEPGRTIVSFSSDGKFIATGGSDGKVKLWSTTGMLIRDIPAAESPVTDIRFSRDDRLFFVSHESGEAGVWNAGGKRSAVLKSNDLEYYDFTTFGVAGEFYSAASDGKIRVHGADATIKKGYFLEDSPLLDLSLSVSEKTLAAVNGAGKVYFLNSDGVVRHVHEDGRNPEKYMTGYSSVVMIGDDEAILGGRDGRVFVLRFSDSSSSEERELNGHKEAVADLAFSGPSSLVYSSSEDGEFIVQTLEGEVRIREFRSKGSVRGMFSPDGKDLLLLSSEGKAELTSPDPSRKEDRFFPGSGTAAAISMDGERIALGDPNGVTRIWSKKGKLLRLFDGHTGAVRYLSFLENRSMVFAGDRAGIHLLFDNSVRQLSIVPTDHGNLVFDRDHRFDLTGQKAAEMVAFRRGWGTKLLELDQFFERFFYPGLFRKTNDGVLTGPGLSEILERSPPPIVKLKLKRSGSSPEVVAMVRACDAGGGAGSPLLYWNNSLFSLDKTKAQIADRKAGCLEKRLPLRLKEGENILQGAAYSSEGIKGFSNTEEVLVGEVGKQDTGIHLIIIGVGRYERIGLPGRNAESDAMRLWEKFDPGLDLRRKGVEGAPSPPQNLSVYTALGKNATRSGILKAFQQAAERVKPGELVIVYMGGAGAVVDGRFLFFQYDNQYDTMASIQNGINQDEIITMISELSTPYKILLMEGVIPSNPPVPFEPASDFRVARTIARMAGIHAASFFIPGKAKLNDPEKPPELSVLLSAFFEVLDGKGAKENVPAAPTRNALPFLESRIPEVRDGVYRDLQDLPGDVASRGSSYYLRPDRL